MSSLKELKGGYNYKTLNSPKKVDRAVRCAVLTKSPLRDNGKGAMFSMTLCDRDTSSTMRGVSFEEKLFDKFEPTKTYDLKAFKVKRGFRGEEIEMLLPENVEVNMALVQYPIEKRTFTIAQILRRETANVRFFTVKAKVIYIDDAQMVGKAPNDKLMREVQLGDTTGTIILVLWRRRAELESLNFKEDNVVVIENAVSSTFSGNVVISTAEETTINATNDEMNLEMSSENAASPCKKSKISCIETSVSAVKDFKCECRCVNCRRDIDWLASSTGGTASCSSGDEDLGFVKCPGCNTILRADAGKIRNECKLLLSYNNAWFLASSGVLQHMLEWASAKRELSEQDVCMLLTSKYTMRLDVDRKVVEYAANAGVESSYFDMEPQERKKLKISEADHASETGMVVDHDHEAKSKVE